jgi:hypothetical protein
MLLSECLQAEFFSPMTIIHDILSNLAILAIFVIDLFMPALFNWLKYFHASLVNYYSRFLYEIVVFRALILAWIYSGQKFKRTLVQYDIVCLMPTKFNWFEIFTTA